MIYEVRLEQGTLVTCPAAIRQGIQETMNIGYNPRQIAERVEKGARQGPEPAQPMSVSGLPAEGRERHPRYLARKTMATPSKAEVRRAQSLVAIRAYAKA